MKNFAKREKKKHLELWHLKSFFLSRRWKRKVCQQPPLKKTQKKGKSFSSFVVRRRDFPPVMRARKKIIFKKYSKSERHSRHESGNVKKKHKRDEEKIRKNQSWQRHKLSRFSFVYKFESHEVDLHLFLLH